jgi:predicted PurR-regulated permease PerM
MSQDPGDAGPVADIVEDIAEVAAAKASEAARTEAALAAEGIDPEDPLTDPDVQRVAAEVSEENPFGVPGPPTSRWSPYRVGFFGGLGVLTAYAAGHALILIRPVLVLLLISFFLAAGLNPAVEFFIRKGISRGRAVGIVLAVVLLGFIGFLFAIVPPIADQTGSLIDNAPHYLDDLNKNSRVRELDQRFHVVTKAKDFFSSPDLATNAVGGVLGVGKVVFGAVFSAITVLTLTLYFMSSFPKMKESAHRAIPRTRRARVGLLTDDIIDRIGGYVAGALTIAAVAGVTSFILLFSLGVPYPVTLALIVMLTDLIPVIGATIGAVIVTGIAFTDSVHVGIAVGVFYLIYQQVENYLLYPRIMKRSVDVSPAVTIIAVLVGASLMGIVGALLAIPIAAAIQLIMVEVVIPRQDQH